MKAHRLLYLLLGFVLGLCVGHATADAAVVEVQVHANKDGWAKLHAEGGWLEGCTMSIGPCQLFNSDGKATYRRVRVHKGANRIRIKAFRWEAIPAERFDYGWLQSSDPDDVPQQAAVRLERAPLNWVYVWGQVAGQNIDPKEMMIR